MSAHAYTEDQRVEQPAIRGKAKNAILKAEMFPPEAIAAAIVELTRDLLPPRLLSGQVALSPAEEPVTLAANRKRN